MEETKLEKSGKANNDPLATSYKPIPETDMEVEAVSRPKSLVKLKTAGEFDGADEKMLPKEDTKVAVPNSTIDHFDAKGSPNDKQNGEAKLDIGEPKSIFGGMDKEELMKYANDPFWVRLRWFLFIAFWLLWAAMLVGAVMIIYAAPKCDPPPPRTWWQKGPLTEVKPDTVPEDIKSLDKNIQGVIVTWPGDAYAEFDESHDVVKIIKQAKDQGVNVIIDLNPATSYVWFESSEDRNNSWSDYYIWKPAKNSANGGPPEAPNNWLNVNNQSSWKYSDRRKEFYYSPLDVPHLNFRNENVTEEFSKIIEKFLGHGASGIRIRNAPLLLVDSKFENEKGIANVAGFDHTQYGFYTHSKTENLPELAPLLKKWRKVVRNKTENGPFMVAEELTSTEAFKINDSFVVDLPLQAHVFSKQNLVVSEIVNSLNHTFSIENIEWPLWKVNNSALPKDVLDIVTFLLPGSSLVNANDNFDEHLLKIRDSPSVMRGICSIHSVKNDSIFAFIRVTSGNPGVLVALNTQNETITVNFPKEIPALSQLDEVTVQLYSKNFNETDFMDVNAKKPATAVPISPKSAIVLSYVPKKKE